MNVVLFDVFCKMGNLGKGNDRVIIYVSVVFATRTFVELARLLIQMQDWHYQAGWDISKGRKNDTELEIEQNCHENRESVWKIVEKPMYRQTW